MKRLAVLLRLALALAVALAAPMVPRAADAAGAAGAAAGAQTPISVVLCSGRTARLGPDGSILPPSEGEAAEAHGCLACQTAGTPAPAAAFPATRRPRSAPPPGPAAAALAAPVLDASARGPPARV